MHSQGILLSVTGTPKVPRVHLIKAIRPTGGPPTSLAAGMEANQLSQDKFFCPMAYSTVFSFWRP